MFTPKRASILSTPNAARVTRSQSLKTKSDGTSAAAMVATAAMSPLCGTSGNHSPSLNRISLTMSSIYNDAILESYKAPLPIRINELIFQHKTRENMALNATMLTNGHVCLSVDKKLFVWKLKKSFKSIQCNELSVPATRSMLKSNCVSVECHNNKDYVGICATNEGAIRFWPSIFNEYLCVDTKIDLQQGDEVAHLMFIGESFYVIITANGNLWSILIETVDGRTMLSCRQIDTSSGFISSVGRRMTSMLFGGGSSAYGSASGRNVQNFKAACRYKTSSEMYMLVEKNLQKWKISNENTLSLLGQTNMEKAFYEEYLAQNVNASRISIHFQDMSITKNSLYVLAIVEDDGAKLVIGELDVYARGSSSSDMKLKSLYVLNYSLKNSTPANGEAASTPYRMHALSNQHAFFVYNAHSIVSFTGPSLEMSGESRFQTLGDRLVASGFYENELIFFSLNHGMLKTKDNALRLSIDDEGLLAGLGDVNNQSMDGAMICAGNTSMMFRPAAAAGIHFASDASLVNVSAMDEAAFNYRSTAHHFDFTASHTTSNTTIVGSSSSSSSEHMMLNRFKEAFQCYLKKEEREAQMLLDELLDVASGSGSFGGKVDLLCVELSEKLIDDMPAHDPRWAELNSSMSAGSAGGKSLSTNFIISNQIKSKQRLHEYYVSFLKKMGVWPRLGLVNYNGRDITSVRVLREHAEKLHLALVLREQLHARNPELLSQAIEIAVRARDEQQPSAAANLTRTSTTSNIYAHDVFYRRVSRVDDIFDALYQVESEVIKVNSSEQAIAYMLDTIHFFTRLLQSSAAYSADKAKLYERVANEQQSTVRGDGEHIRWTFLPLKELTNTQPSVLAVCVKQHRLAAEYGLSNCNTMENRAAILHSLVDLDTLIMDEHAARLATIPAPSNNTTTTTTEGCSSDDAAYVNFKATYDALKTKLLDVYVKQRQHDQALALADKYVDFHTLIAMCEIRGDVQQLEAYLDKFAATTFAEFVVRHFIERRKLNFILRAQLLRRADIARCLDKYPFLSWIKDLKQQQQQQQQPQQYEQGGEQDAHAAASRTLASLGHNETDSFMKQKTLLSLSKLSLLASASASASDGGASLQARLRSLDRQLAYLAHVEHLAPRVAQHYAMSVEHIPCYKPEKLIELYIGDAEAGELEFRRALAIVDYLKTSDADEAAAATKSTTYYTSEQLKQLRADILARSVLADNWEKLYEQADAEAYLSESKLFKTMRLVKQESSGESFQHLRELSTYLLRHERLAHFANNTKFEYLLHACFELAACS